MTRDLNNLNLLAKADGVRGISPQKVRLAARKPASHRTARIKALLLLKETGTVIL